MGTLFILFAGMPAMGLLDRLRGTDAPRVAFLGLGGVPFELVEDNPGTFPTLSSIAESGSAGAIESIVPPESTACWPALTTGANPGETGVYGVHDREVGTYRTYVPNGQDVQRTRIWDRVTKEGRKASVFNVPVTFPPQRNLQRMVSGCFAPEADKAGHPEDVRQFLEGHDYIVDVNAKLGHKADKSAFLDHAHRTLDARQGLFRHYVEQDDWDLFVGVYMTPDRVNHFLWEEYTTEGRYHEEFLAFYERLDEYIGEIRSALPSDVTLVVASDHGFTGIDYELNANEWLRREGWLSYGDDDPTGLADIDDDTRAFSLMPGRFYLNVEGREPRGAVAEAEYDEVRTDLKRSLERMTGPDDRPVIDRVVDKETAFRGDHDAIAPDLVAIPNDGYDLKAGFRPVDDAFDDSGHRTGMHTFDDAALFVDERGVATDDADLLDIAPTLLDLLNIEFERTAYDGASLL